MPSLIKTPKPRGLFRGDLDQVRSEQTNGDVPQHRPESRAARPGPVPRPDDVTNERRKQPRYLNARLVRIQEVETICSLSRANIYNAIKHGTFPAPIKTGPRASAWIKQEIEGWIEQRIAKSRRLQAE